MDIEQIPEAILDDLKKYTEEKSKKISEAVKECTEMAFEDIQNDSPVRKKVPKSEVVLVHGVAKENYQPGSYKKGWMTVTKSYEKGRVQGYVRNKTNYQLTHLLERGHKARDGSNVAPIPHIVDNQNKAREELGRMIEEILEE
ncbi:MAG: hypothetical protein ACI4JK_02035 [Oscillospiraceae bacterium]